VKFQKLLFQNQRKVSAAGVSVKVSFQTMTGQKLKAALVKILEEPSYQKNMKLMSQRFRDQPELPLTRAVWWVEWALRNPNPDHMASPVQQLGFIRAHSLDVLFTVLLVIAVVIHYIRKVVRALFGGSRSKNDKVTGGKKRN
jgi:glucuronosyltransferase